MLYWDDFHTFSILKGFLALLRRFLVCHCLPTSCLTVLRTEVGEFFGCWKIFSVRFDLIGVWDIKHHHFCLLLTDLQVNLLSKNAEIAGLVLHTLMSV